MAKASMRPEVKAQKMKDNRNKLPIKCTCGSEAAIIHGDFHKRIADCWHCYTNPPQGSKNDKALKILKQIGLV